LPDLELLKCLAGGGPGALDRNGDDRLDTALSKVDTTPRAGTGGRNETAGEQE
jgi:hypothetical protein